MDKRGGGSSMVSCEVLYSRGGENDTRACHPLNTALIAHRHSYITVAFDKQLRGLLLVVLGVMGGRDQQRLHVGLLAGARCEGRGRSDGCYGPVLLVRVGGALQWQLWRVKWERMSGRGYSSGA